MYSSMQLARAKFYRPRLAHELVARPRLLEQLDSANTKPVTLVSAPAGYGKSTLIADWLEHSPLPSTWLSLDEHDNDLNLFGAYLVAAIQCIFPGALQSAAALLNSSRTPPLVALANALSNDIAELPTSFILVLDDYHMIQEPAIHTLLSDLIKSPLEPLHLVLATRTDAALPLSKLRAAGQLCEVRARDLRFTMAETDVFLRCTVGKEISSENVQLLQERTEGWAVALRFAAQLLRQGSDTQDHLAQQISRNDSQLTDYLLYEVLAQQSPEVKELFLKTSLLPQFTAELCDALMDSEDAARTRELLQELEQKEILVALTDGQETWYRYHHLVQDFLRVKAIARYDAARIAELHRRASRWYKKHGMITEAIQELLAAGDLKYAAQIVHENLHPVLNREEGRSLIALWFGFFPSEFAEQTLELVITKLWLVSIHFRLGAAPPLIARAEELLAAATELDDASRRSILGEIAYFKAALAYWRNNSAQTIEITSHYYDYLPREYEFARGNMLGHYALTLQTIEQTDRALELLTNALKDDHSDSSRFQVRIMVGFAFFYLNVGELRNLVEISESLLLMTKRSSAISQVFAYYFLGLAHYEWNQLELAAQHFNSAAELRYIGNVKASHESLGYLMLTQQAQGLSSAAAETFQELVHFTDELQSGALIYDANAFRARLALMQGNVDAALLWATSVSFDSKPHMVFDVAANLTRLQTLLETRKPENIRLMLEETQALLAFAKSTHSTRRQIQLHALHALALDALGKQSAALDALAKSIGLAERGGFVRTYVDLGTRMTHLLNLLLARNIAPDYVQQILAATPGGGTAKFSQAPWEKTDVRVIEPLTLREMEVLEHLAQRQSDKEIARALVISPLTVKAHTDHIYHKLGVNSRREAVQVAKEFGILDSHLPGALPN
ncbi:MAG: hypothetical protein EYC68_06025 [Chloroflexota bacterium]|nr:MAG: hypothetical protein EYC68_06025 [Chloroflexota bacterium]